MAIKAIVDKLEDAPDALREHYRAGTADEGTEGKFVLGVDAVSGFALENVTGLKSALGAERGTRERLEREVIKFKDIDPDKARTALTELEELKRLDPTAEADRIANTKFENAKSQLIDKHTQELGARDQRIGKLAGTVAELLIDAVATAGLAEAKGSVDLLLPHVRAHTRVKETEDGKFLVEVIDKDGNARIADAKGSPMGIKDLIAEMRKSDTYARAFEGDGHSGGGAEGGNGGGGGAEKGDVGGTRSERAAHFAKKFNLPAS